MTKTTRRHIRDIYLVYEKIKDQEQKPDQKEATYQLSRGEVVFIQDAEIIPLIIVRSLVSIILDRYNGQFLILV